MHDLGSTVVSMLSIPPVLLLALHVKDAGRISIPNAREDIYRDYSFVHYSRGRYGSKSDGEIQSRAPAINAGANLPYGIPKVTPSARSSLVPYIVKRQRPSPHIPNYNGSCSAGLPIWLWALKLWISPSKKHEAEVSLIIINLADVRNNHVSASQQAGSPAPHRFPEVVAVGLFSVLTDTALACGVIMTLRKQRPGFIQTERAMIILYVVESGIATSIFSIVILIANMTGNSLDVVGAGVPFGGVYILSILAHLHSRTGIRARLANEHRIRASANPQPSSLEMAAIPGQLKPGVRVSLPRLSAVILVK
ncbi:hypothetical protein DL93DRAFT_2099372 [Clavulina sp. PMI_390]|nr:hypothetical protein DL93DRAFT_2099372 [Clavulina sp. PMI_390]